MATATARRAVGALAVPALAFGLAACGDAAPQNEAEGGSDGAARSGAKEAILASYGNLADESYVMEGTVSVDGITFMDMSSTVSGERSRAVQDLHMGALLEAMGEEIPADNPALAELFADMHTESIFVDGVVYMQMSGGMLDTFAAEYGEDVWFTLDVAQSEELGELYSQIGSFDLTEQTRVMIEELSDVEETSPGVYTGTLKSDSEIFDSVLGAMGPGARGGAELLADIQLTITLDENGLLNKLEMTMPEIEGMNVSMEFVVTEIGGDYTIEAPDSENLVPFEELGFF
jgi:hypothetical protein